MHRLRNWRVLQHVWRIIHRLDHVFFLDEKLYKLELVICQLVVDLLTAETFRPMTASAADTAAIKSSFLVVEVSMLIGGTV